MENIINKVISIDKKASEIIKHTDEYLSSKENDIKEKIKAMKMEIMKNTKAEADELYESIVKEGEAEAEKIRSKSKEECGRLEAKFAKIKDVLENKLFSRIFS